MYDIFITEVTVSPANSLDPRHITKLYSSNDIEYDVAQVIEYIKEEQRGKGLRRFYSKSPTGETALITVVAPVLREGQYLVREHLRTVSDGQSVDNLLKLPRRG